MVKIIEHSSPHYSPRTWHNASVANITIAFAVDFTTAGEILTKKASKNYLAISINSIHKDSTIHKVICAMNDCNAKVVNIAGNGLYTLMKHQINQLDINIAMHKLLKTVDHNYGGIYKIVSGGQTGVDFAAGVACNVLGIDCVMTFPKGFKQRTAIGQDIEHTRAEIRSMIKTQSKYLI